MLPFDPAFVEKLPWSIQILMYGAIFIASVIAMIFGYRKRSNEAVVSDRVYDAPNPRVEFELRRANEVLSQISDHCGEIEKQAIQQTQIGFKVAEATGAILVHLREEASYRRGWRDHQHWRE